MKTSLCIIRNVGLGSLLALALGLGLGLPQVWADSPSSGAARPVETIKSMKQVEELKPGSQMLMVCGACKNVSITEYKSANPNGRPPLRWVEVGSKHECEHCGGSISIVEGKVKDEMQHNCSKCGEGAAFCCAVSPPAKKK